jgi:UDP-2,3-diacylglucosamine pyrophosphatase LpxH
MGLTNQYDLSPAYFEQTISVNTLPKAPAPEDITLPRGTSFTDSPRVKTAARIREEFMSRTDLAQNECITPIYLPYPKKTATLGIWHVGDVHIGTDACAYRAFKSILSYVLDHDDEYIAFQGDMVDFLTGVSVGVMAEQSMTVQEQFTLATDDLLELARARKILFILRGNHEDRLDKATKNIVDAAQTMARTLDVHYLQTEGWTKIHVGDQSYLSYNIHGFPAGNKPGPQYNKMQAQLAGRPDADIITCGHNHISGIVANHTERVRPGDLRRYVKTSYGVYTSTFHSYLGYARDAGYTPGPMGTVRISFNAETGALKPDMIPVILTGQHYTAVLPDGKA